MYILPKHKMWLQILIYSKTPKRNYHFSRNPEASNKHPSSALNILLPLFWQKIVVILTWLQSALKWKSVEYQKGGEWFGSVPSIT